MGMTKTVTKSKPKNGVRKSSSEGVATRKKKYTADGAIYVVMNRRELKSAPYNPRDIDSISRKKLKRSIENTDGLIQPPIFNKRTGNIVGGHQRISLLDDINGTNDYELTVAVVDYPLEKEIEVNIALNSQASQGVFNVESLDDLLSREGVELSNTGFDIADIELMHMNAGVDLPEWMVGNEGVESAKMIEDLTEDIEGASEEAEVAEIDNEAQEEIGLIKKRKEEFKERQEFFGHEQNAIRVIFPTNGAKKLFMQHFALDPNLEFADGGVLLEHLGLADDMNEVIEKEKPKKAVSAKKKGKRNE